MFPKIEHIFLTILRVSRRHKYNFPILLYPNLPDNPIIRLNLRNRRYISNIKHILPELNMLGPASKKVMRLQYIILIPCLIQKLPKIALHPLDIIILPPHFELIRNQVTKLPPGNGLQGPNRILKHDPELMQQPRRRLVNLIHLLVDQAEQLLDLVLALLQVGVHLLDLGGYALVVVLYLLQLVGQHRSLGVVAVDLAAYAHG